MGRVVILSGVSGSGKTPFAKQLCEEHVKNNSDQNAVRIAIDDFFVDADGRYKFLKSLVHKAVSTTYRQFIQSMLGGIDLIVIDNQNCLLHEVYSYIVAANAYGYQAEVITFRCTADKLQALAERSEHRTPIKQIQHQYRNIGYRKFPGWWKNTDIQVEV